MNIIAKLRARRDGDESGFTLIELMVVVLIIAILIAIAIPTFLGAQNKAKDRAAQSSLRNSLTSAKTLYTDSSDYTTATPAALQAVEPSLTFCTAAVASKCNAAGLSIGPKGVSVSNTNADVIVFAVAQPPERASTCGTPRPVLGLSSRRVVQVRRRAPPATPDTTGKAWNADGW